MRRYVSEDVIKETLSRLNLPINEKSRTVYTICPGCHKGDKLSILKANGFTICYRGSCEFKGPHPFVKFVAKTLDISLEEANLFIFNEPIPKDFSLTLNLEEPVQAPQVMTPLNPLPVISWPLIGLMPITDKNAVYGQKYLLQRGVDIELAQFYDFYYDPKEKRIVMPVKMGQKVYGYQARSILPNALVKIKSNAGFPRAQTLMFYDQAIEQTHIILAEGPFDAIKFHYCGGNIATMGKMISNAQIDLILAKRPQKIYFALDDDAASELRKLIWKIKKKCGILNIVIPQLYKINLPNDVYIRCKLLNKKPDFGECSFEECINAFNNAQIIDNTTLFLYLKEEI